MVGVSHPAAPDVFAMNQKPPVPPAPPRPADARAERLAAALRDNLRRRKVQGKARAAEAESPPPAPQSPHIPGK